MPSFDIVSKYDMQEVDNAVNMVKRDINNRYDFRGTNTHIVLNTKESTIKIESNSEMHLNSVRDMLEKRAIGRKLSIKIFQYNEIEKATGMSVRQNIVLQAGLSKEKTKMINKLIKDTKLKVQSQIQGEQIRVTAKKIDDLQCVISTIKEQNMDIPLQFVNLK